MVWIQHSPSKPVLNDLYKYNSDYFVPNYASNVELEVVEETLEEQVIKHKIYEIVKYYNEQLGMYLIPNLFDIELVDFNLQTVHKVIDKMLIDELLEVIGISGKNGLKLGANKL